MESDFADCNIIENLPLSAVLTLPDVRTSMTVEL